MNFPQKNTVIPLAENKNLARANISFWALNWLRFTLALYLVLFHTFRGNYTPIAHTWISQLFALGNFATSVFFVLSGFLLTHAYVVRKNYNPVNMRNFLIARFSTLYPIHVFGLLLATLPVLATIYSDGGIRVPLNESGSVLRMLGQAELAIAFIMNLMMLNAWNPFYLSFNFASWSLSALAFYYLLFPLLTGPIIKIKSPMSALLSLAVLFAIPGLVVDLLVRPDLWIEGLLHRNPVLRLPLFVAGMILCVMLSKREVETAVVKFFLLVVCLATFLFGIFLTTSESHLHIVQNGLYLPACVAVIWLCVYAKPVRSSIRYWGDRLGAASLPIFFLHAPMYDIFVKLEKVAVAICTAPGSNLKAIIAIGRNIEPTMVLYPLYLLFLIFICVLMQEKFVIPLQSWIRRLFLQKNKFSNIATNAIFSGTAKSG